MTTTATPTLTVAGSAVPLGPAGAAAVGIDVLAVTWGRGSLLEHPTPATAQLTVLDTARGFPWAARRDLIGQPVVLGWTATPAGAGTLFRGRITDAAVIPQAGGMRIDLTCASKEVDGGNYKIPANTVFPNETYAARLSRIVGYLPAGFFAGGVTLPTQAISGDTQGQGSDYSGYLAAKMDASGADVLSLLRQLWDSCYPLPLVYDPAADQLLATAPPTFAFPSSMGGMNVLGTGRLIAQPAYGGRYLGTAAAPLSGATGRGIDAEALGYSGPLSSALDTKLTRAELGWYDPAAAYAQATRAAAVPGVDESVLGRRVLSVDTACGDATNIARLATNWAALAGGAAAARRLEALTYSTARRPFADLDTATAMLGCRETGAVWFVNGSWPARVGHRPMFTKIGGTVSYAAGEWSVELTPAGVSVDTVHEVPLRISGASSPAAAARLVDVDPSLTFGDLAFVTIGAGYDTLTQPL